MASLALRKLRQPFSLATLARYKSTVTPNAAAWAEWRRVERFFATGQGKTDDSTHAQGDDPSAFVSTRGYESLPTTPCISLPSRLLHHLHLRRCLSNSIFTTPLTQPSNHHQPLLPPPLSILRPTHRTTPTLPTTHHNPTTTPPPPQSASSTAPMAPSFSGAGGNLRRPSLRARRRSPAPISARSESDCTATVQLLYSCCTAVVTEQTGTSLQRQSDIMPAMAEPMEKRGHTRTTCHIPPLGDGPSLNPSMCETVWCGAVSCHHACVGKNGRESALGAEAPHAPNTHSPKVLTPTALVR